MTAVTIMSGKVESTVQRMSLAFLHMLPAQPQLFQDVASAPSRNSPKVEGIITLLWSALLATSLLVRYSMKKLS